MPDGTDAAKWQDKEHEVQATAAAAVAQPVPDLLTGWRLKSFSSTGLKVRILSYEHKKSGRKRNADPSLEDCRKLESIRESPLGTEE